MIIQKEFLNKLKDFGLNSYEGKLWAALLSRGVSTAGELSDIANVPRSRCYDVLESLEKKGFIIMKVGKPIKYIAVSPTEVIERVKKRINNDAEQQINIVESIKESKVIDELNFLHSQGIDLVDPTDLSGSLKGRNNLYNHMESMVKNAKEKIYIMTTAQGLIRKSESLKNAFEKANKKGVEIKIAAPLTKDTSYAVKTLSRYAEIKHTDDNSRFCVVDGKEVAFMLVDDEKVHPTYDAGVWVTTQIFSKTLENYFNLAWGNGKAANKYTNAS
ncbi:hypothetical protein GF336_06825 [Candidatus Woesearchaeota archaeon]|nr:hypothetical protein [Candidatus Woesearchaeota archaeon]